MEKSEISQNVIETGELLVKAIKACINDEEFQFGKDTDFEKLYKLAFSHRVASVVAPAIVQCDFASAEIKAKFKKELFRVGARYEAQKEETEEISQLFSGNGIRHCFLKGVKVCAFHKHPESRFMLDMDVFVDSEKETLANELLIQRGYEKTTFGDDKDAGYSKKPFFNIELHRELKYDYDKGYEYYKGAFNRMVTEDGYALNMTNEDFYVYILSHTAHHFEVSGTGIKNIIDHYFLKEKLKPICDVQVLEKSLEDIGLSEFCKNVDALCDYWFKDTAPAENIKEMSDYIILSGVFGNETNQYFSGVIRGEYENKKSSYIIKRLFPGLDFMQNKFPVLKKLPFLLPLFWIARILNSLFSAKRITAETKSVSGVETDNFEVYRSFLQNMGL